HARRAVAPARPRARARRRAAGWRTRGPRPSRSRALPRQCRVRGPGRGVQRRRPVSGIDRADRPAGGRLRHLAEKHRARVASASQLTPNRLGGEPARFLGLAEARLRPVTALVAIGVEVAAEWPVFVIAAAALVAYYVPDWRDAARIWLHRHRAGELVTVEIVALLVLLVIYLLQRLVRSGMVRHRV